MSVSASRLKTVTVSIVTGSLMVISLFVAGALPATAAAAPIVQPANDAMTADRLPTVQIDGVVWSQAVVGNTVYAGGRFSNARPAGAAAGTNLTPRANLLAYDITTGNLVTSFAPSLNGQVLGVAASPDGTRIYVVGDFTTANGQARRRVAAYSTATGQLISTFNPSGPNSQARSVVATNDTVYVGGGFLGLANGTARNNLVAYSAANGAVLPWNPSATGVAGDANAAVWALGITANGAAVFAGGQFQNVGGQPAYGLAKVSGSGNGTLDTTWQPSVRNAGKDSGVASLVVQNNHVYGTAWHFGPGGNLEGVFKAPTDGSTDPSDVSWVTDCHGDFYSSHLASGIVYSVGHSHYCGNMGGGFPQYSTWKFQHAQAWSDTQTGDILNDVHGYPNWHGVEPGPSMVNWMPDLAIGTFTGQGQAGWNVTGTSNGDYVVYGGEFPRVNGVGQQGLVRFARRSIAPKAEGPRFAVTPFVPTLTATSTSTLRVSWPAGFDRDDKSLTYQAIRSGVGTPRATITADSQWWHTPILGFVDTGLTPGATYSYRIVVRDPGGNTVQGSTVSVTMPTSFAAANAYAQSVRELGATHYWPLNDTSGTTMTNRAAGSTASTNVGVNDGRVGTGLSWGAEGAITGDPAANVNGDDTSRVYTLGTESAPDTFTTQAWIKTTTPNGGRIFGFGDLQTGTSGHRDRHVYMDNAGRLNFGVRAQDGSNRTVGSARAYNDGQWHMVTATMDAQGMALYVDGVRVGRRADTTQGETYVGNWRLGGDNLDGWPNRPNAWNFSGTIDEVAVYPTALTQAQVNSQYVASGRTSVVPPAPADAYGAAVYADEPDLFWRFDETSGTRAADSGKTLNDGTYRNGVSLGQPGKVSTAAGFDGNNQFVSSDGVFSNPTLYSTEAWFKTTSNRGGKIIGFGNDPNGSSGAYDRHVYMQDDGRLVFGVWTGQTNTITSASPYNDGEWHHVVATQSGTGMKLYVDGVRLGTHPQTAAQDYAGHWKVGGDNTWGSSSAYLAGAIDEAAVYSAELPAARVLAHFTAGGGRLNEAPTAAFTSSSQGRRATFDASTSSDPDGTVTGYAWDFGDDTTGTGANPVHVYPAAGTYDVTLTVTDNKGATDAETKQVTISNPTGPADAYGRAVYADGPRIYWRFDEASGNTAVDASGLESTGTYYNGVTLGQDGALPGTGDKAAAFDGGNGFASSDEAFANPTVYSEEAWFKTTSTSGGKIIGFGANRTGTSWSYDRHVWMTNSGALVFGTWTGQMNTITSSAGFNDGDWHHVVASQSGNGMKLYVDGELAGTNPQTQAEPYTGYWKVGGDIVWFDANSNFLNGAIDEVAIYETELSAARVAAHFAAAQPAPNQKPVASFTANATNLEVAVNGTGSTDPDGTIASYLWDFGDDTAGATTALVNHTYDEPGTYTITLTVTDNDGATDTATREVTVAPANQSPEASFTAAVDDLEVNVDASASDDPDGTISSYAWNFGDDETGTGETASHTYDEPGTYTVTLTVTDNRGGTDTVTRQVTVTAPANVDPTASFTAAPDGLEVDVDASASDDPDGTISSYAWDFGDDETGTGKTASHTYDEAGTYTVTLTVTDNRGGTDTATRQVTVTAPVLAADAFERSVANGWGTADIGGQWTISSGSTNFGVSNGAGTMRMNAGAGPSAFLNQVSARDVDVTADPAYDKAGTGGGVYTSLVARRAGTTDYRAKVRVTATATSVQLVRTVSGTETVLSTQTVAGVVYAPGQTLKVRLQAVGSGTTTLRAKVWRSSDAEPTAWTTTTTDNTAALQQAGAVGIVTYLSGSATNAPVTARIPDFSVKPLP